MLAAPMIPILMRWSSGQDHCRTLVRRLEELDGVAIRILELDLPAGRAGFHFIAKMHARVLQRFDHGRKIGDAKNDPVPSARFLTMAVRHRARTRSSRATQKNLQAVDRDGRKLGQLLMLQLETKLLGIE